MMRIRASYELFVVVFVLAFFLLFISSVTSNSLMLWDESVYAGMGKWMASGGEYGVFEEFRPFFLPLLIAPWILMGLDIVIAAKVIAAIFSALMLVMTFLLAREMMDARTGVFAMLLVAFSQVFFAQSFRFMTEIPSALLVLAAFFALIKDRPYLAGLLGTLAFAMRFPAGLIVPVLILVALIMRGRDAAVAVGVAFAASMMVVLGAYYVFLGDAIGPFLSAMSHQGNVAHAVSGWGGMLFYPLALVMMQPFLIAALFSLHERRARILLVPIGIALIYFSLITNKQERFILLVLPFFAILAGMVLSRMVAWRVALLGIGIIGLVLVHPIYASNAGFEGNPVQEFYRSVPLMDPVATSDPVFAVYRDVRFIPIYFSYDDVLVRMAGARSVLFSREAYACGAYGQVCEDSLDEVERVLGEEYVRSEGFVYEGVDYALFSLLDLDGVPDP